MNPMPPVDPFLADKPGFVLAPCPFCNSSDIERARRRDFPVATRCRECGAEGPAKLTGREADTAWNIRASAAHPEPVPETIRNWNTAGLLLSTPPMTYDPESHPVTKR